jgi:hypothetical protein
MVAIFWIALKPEREMRTGIAGSPNGVEHSFLATGAFLLQSGDGTFAEVSTLATIWFSVAISSWSLFC